MAVRKEFFEAELISLSCLCRHWAERLRERQGAGVDSRPGYQLGKIKALRRAVIKGEARREAWEHEFVQDEIEVMLDVVRHVRGYVDRKGPERLQGVATSPIPFPVGADRSAPIIKRPLPGPRTAGMTALEYLIDRRSTDASIAKRIVAARLGCSRRRIGDALTNTGRVQTSAAQRLAASIFYDLSLSVPTGAGRLRAQVLNGLYQSGYPPICLYYLVQRAQGLAPSEPFEICLPDEIAKLCGFLRAQGRGAEDDPFLAAP